MTLLEHTPTMMNQAAQKYVGDDHRLGTDDDVLVFWEAVATSRNEELRRSRKRLDAYVNNGRWVADCECGSGVAVSPNHEHAACMECLTVYSDVRFPKQRKALEEALMARPSDAREWCPGESAADLLEQNFRLGFSKVVAP